MTAMGEGLNFSSTQHTAGSMLADARQRQNLSVAEVSSRLRLSHWQVDALENDEYDRLPGPTFIRGIIRSYAKALNVDPQPALDAYSRVAPDGTQVAINVPSHNIRFDPSSAAGSNASFKIGLIALALAIAAGVSWSWYSGTDQRVRPAVTLPAAKPAPVVPPIEASSIPPQASTQSATPPLASQAPVQQTQSTTQQPLTPPQISAPVSSPVSVDKPSHNAPTATASTTTTPAATPVLRLTPQAVSVAKSPAASVKPALRLMFQGDSWVEVKDGTRKVIFKQLNRGGTEQVLTGTPPFKLVVGNATVVRLFYNDKPIDMSPHTQVHVARLTVE